MSDPYASHMEFLIRYCSHARCVLELGCGDYSTPLFLNKTIFTQVERVLSLEHDQVWADKIKAAFPDPRLQLVLVTEPLEDYLCLVKMHEFDLVFVDNGTDASTRAKTIEYIARNSTTGQKVVIHDYENQEYRDAARPFKHCILDGFRLPQTAMVWK